MNWYKKAKSGIRLWLDDGRDPKDPDTQEKFGAKGDEVWVKTVPEAIEYLTKNNVVSISLDNDLGQPQEGYDLAKWIEEKAYWGELKRLEWRVHSKNNSKAPFIVMALQKADEFWRKNELV
jgi:hypothetical protein